MRKLGTIWRYNETDDWCTLILAKHLLILSIVSRNKHCKMAALVILKFPTKSTKIPQIGKFINYLIKLSKNPACSGILYPLCRKCRNEITFQAPSSCYRWHEIDSTSKSLPAINVYSLKSIYCNRITFKIPTRLTAGRYIDCNHFNFIECGDVSLPRLFDNDFPSKCACKTIFQSYTEATGEEPQQHLFISFAPFFRKS